MSFVSTLKRFFDAPDAPLSDRDLAELGLSRTDFTQLINATPGTRERMEAMAAQFDLSAQDIDGDRGQALELAERCGYCASARACQNAVDLGVDFDPEQCPNAERYDAMRKRVT